MNISPIQDIIAELAAGRMVVLVDEEDRENEGDLVMAADHVTPEAINFMARFGRGLICLTLTEDKCRQLNLPLMVRDNKSSHGTAFTVSIEAAEGVTTGISAHDRSRTIQAAVDKSAKPSDIVQPGHIFPLMAQNGGVLVRAGHTEAGCDLARLAGLQPASVICEILKDDGTMARLPDLMEFSAVHNLKIGTIRDLIQYRSRNEKQVECVAERDVVGPHGAFRLRAYLDRVSGEVHFALIRGTIEPEVDVPVRVHQPLSILDFIDFHGQPYTYTIDRAMQTIAQRNLGVLILLQRKEIGKEMIASLTAEKSDGTHAVKWDPRLFGIGAQILRDIGVRRMHLMMNQRKFPSMGGFDLEVTGFIPPEQTEA
jgi:3,4-dihydroxy 2-butanone 4-phosphate synthase/GTP cyclohydrolase II